MGRDKRKCTPPVPCALGAHGLTVAACRASGRPPNGGRAPRFFNHPNTAKMAARWWTRSATATAAAAAGAAAVVAACCAATATVASAQEIECPPPGFDSKQNFNLTKYTGPDRWYVQEQMEILYLPLTWNYCTSAQYTVLSEDTGTRPAARGPGRLGHDRMLTARPATTPSRLAVLSCHSGRVQLRTRGWRGRCRPGRRAARHHL